MWQKLAAHWKNLTILGAVGTLGFTAGSWFETQMDRPRMIEQRLEIIQDQQDIQRARIDTVEARVELHVNGMHATLERNITQATAEREEIVRRLDEAARTRCWLVAKVAPGSVPPPECR